MIFGWIYDRSIKNIERSADVRRYRRLFGTHSVVELAIRSMVEN